jgi:hypothetical protein
MQLDVEDVLAGAVGSVFGRFILFVVAVWLGCTVGWTAMMAGTVAEGTFEVNDLKWFWTAPLMLISSWAVLNVPFLLFSLMRFIRSEGDDYLTWGVVIAVESLAVMVAWVGDSVEGWLPLTVAWAAWLMFSIMLGTGIWLLRQHLINCWARDLGMLRAANAQRRAEREAEERERMSMEEER